MWLFRDDETVNLHLSGTYFDMVKNPNWLEANQLAIIQAWPRIWTLDYRVQIELEGQGRTWTGGHRITSVVL